MRCSLPNCTYCEPHVAEYREVMPAQPLPFDTKEGPAHYTRLDPQPRDVIRAWDLTFGPAAAIKYIARAGHKVGASVADDYRKAINFLQWELDHLEKTK